MLAFVLPFVVALGQAAPGPVYNARRGEVHARPPRLEAEAKIDGVLDEPAWAAAAVLTGFSQLRPVDGVPADDSTQVLVWYSPTAIYFGIRAFEAHGAAHATLAQRDNISADDNVQILLSTFADARQALVFGVNPLGVQMDGTMAEITAAAGGFGTGVQARPQADLSQDFVFQSKGRVTAWGYEVEVRIPFKSLRYRDAAEQSWGINVIRDVQHSGYEDTWTPVRLAASGFLSQEGTLDGLHGMHRGLVLDLNPELTQQTVGSPVDATDPAAAWRYDAGAPRVGGNVRWGISSNLTLNATVRPDFSQVESDAGQAVFDPREALYFPEKRPFFLDGMEGFATPSNLVYTRRIQQPAFAAKLTGKVSDVSIAVLSALDDRTTSLGYDPALGLRGREPLYDIVRVQRDLGALSRVGVTVTDKEDAGYSNRVADVDGRLVLAPQYTLEFQGAASRTADSTGVSVAPLWGLRLRRNGRQWGSTYAVVGLDSAFVAGAGFIGRKGIATTDVNQRFTWFAPPGRLVESFTFNPVYDLTWKYDHLMRGLDAIEKKFHLNANLGLRGGWSLGAALLLETFGYDPQLYQNVYVVRPPGAAGDTVPFTGTPRIPNRDWVATLDTPGWQWFNGNLTYIWGHDEDFDEWASSVIQYLGATALVRPTEKLRISPSFTLQTYGRASDGSWVRATRIARFKTEYQISRPLFFRVVGQYTTTNRLSLVDESRTGGALLVRNPDGTFAPLAAFRVNDFRMDWLLSYQPTPGTVFYVGYGASSAPAAFMLNQLTETRYRESDAFFVKLSYLFRS
ncbi:MAG: carbohydrate binding family 9 domain-containing protein [Gemmatimonadota bacterium]|nr:carbohydrate binding family 9 domain-containing protein [Gemmatimonadota bacterium]